MLHPSEAVDPIDIASYYADDTGAQRARLNFHEGQIEAYWALERFIALISGTQGGKTSFEPWWLQKEIKDKGTGDYMAISPSFVLMGKKLLPEFVEVFERRFQFGTYHKGDRVFIFSNNGMERTHGLNTPTRRLWDPYRPTQIFFAHADNPQTLESATIKGAVLDEAGQKRFRLDSWEAIQRRLALNQGRALIGTTPYDLGWLKKQVFDRYKAGDTDYRVIQFASIMNPRFPLAEYERAKRTLPKWKFDMFYRGLFVRPAGLIYDCFSEEVNTCHDFIIPDDWPRVIALDFGGINTRAGFYAIHPSGEFFFKYREYAPHITRTAAEHTEAIFALEPMYREYPKRYYFVGGSLSEGQWRTEFKAAGMKIHASFIREIEVGIDRVYGSLKSGEFVIFKSCKYTLDEVDSYSREVDDEGNPIPDTIEDQHAYHSLDETRYAVSYIRRKARKWSDEDRELIDPDGAIRVEETTNDVDLRPGEKYDGRTRLVRRKVP